MMHRNCLRSAAGFSTAALLSAVAGVGSATAQTAGADFRVLPYLQSPSDSGMIINWFTEQNLGGTLTVTGGDLSTPLTFSTTPQDQPLLQYTQRDLDVDGPAGRILFGEGNYKHSVALTGLTPGQTYNYSVQQGGTSFNNTFRTAPSASNWSSVRFIAMSDSETQPQGDTAFQAWPTDTNFQAPGSIGRPAGVTAYPLTETDGYNNNLAIVNSRNPDFVVMPGDLVQGGGYQPGWDQFFRHNAGEFGTTFSDKPLLPAYGNWENFANPNGGYGSATDRSPVVRSRHAYKAYVDVPGNGTPEHQDNYYRVDYGPVTIITLDSSNGEPDQTNRDPNALDVDTQSNFTKQQYTDAANALGLTDDLADLNPGSTQFLWAQAQIEEARAAGQIVFVQFHHAPYSSGVHAFPMSSPQSSGQAGTPMRQYHPMFEELGVAAVFSGHSEMFERSFVDEDGDGIGVNYYDVGVSGDGVRGRTVDNATGLPGTQNPFSRWSADADEPELWQLISDGLGGTFEQLVDGGRHYGHLEINVENLRENGALATAALEDASAAVARVTLTPVYSFPLLDAAGNLVGGSTERRVYGDEIVLLIGADGSVVPEPASAAMLLAASALLLRRGRA